jgi:hypothetical protein
MSTLGAIALLAREGASRRAGVVVVIVSVVGVAIETS